MVNLGVNADVINNIELVIFDKDGTLINLYDYWSNMISYRVGLAREKLGFSDAEKKDIAYAMGVDLEKRRLRNEGPVGLKKREIVMQAMIDALAKIGFPDTYTVCVEVFNEADSFSLERLPEIIRPMDGMHQLIDGLCKERCKIAVATTDKTARAKLAMNVLGISDKVDIVVGEDMVKNCKPSPDMVNVILEKLSVSKENAVMVGDALTDIEMGNKAGLTGSIGVSSGLTPGEKILQKTRHVVGDISGIKIL